MSTVSLGRYECYIGVIKPTELVVVLCSSHLICLIISVYRLFRWSSMNVILSRPAFRTQASIFRRRRDRRASRTCHSRLRCPAVHCAPSPCIKPRLRYCRPVLLGRHRPSWRHRVTRDHPRRQWEHERVVGLSARLSNWLIVPWSRRHCRVSDVRHLLIGRCHAVRKRCGRLVYLFVVTAQNHVLWHRRWISVKAAVSIL